MPPTSLRPSLVTARAALGLVAAAALLAACGGGGGDDDGSATKNSAGTRSQAMAVDASSFSFFPTAAIPADAGTKGMWSPVYSWPLIPVHALMLPDGRVLSYGTKGDGTQTGFFIYDVWDGTTRPDLAVSHLTLPNTTNTDIFCSAQLLLPSASTPTVFLAGGDNWTGTATTNTANNNTTSFDAATNQLTRGPNMNLGRWYGTTTMLANGEVYLQGGAGGTRNAEVRSTTGAMRLLSTSTSGLDYYYPRNFVAPDGRIFGFDSNGKMYYVDPANNGAITLVGQLDTPYIGFSSSAVMFRPGRMLQVGATNSNAATVIDISAGGTPVVTPTGSLSQQRIWVNTTVLPDGKVLATGGSPIGNWYGGANNSAEIWDPQTGVWTRGPAGALARLYHSIALLRPDGSVLVGGGGAPGPLTNTNVEVYYPPYFFTAQGGLAPRPTITSSPTVIDIGKTFSVGVSATGGVSRVTLVKTGSVTHSFNMEQRFMDLTYQANGSSVTVQAPTRAATATPGYYMLFVFDAAGVPSVAQILKVNVASDPNPATTPTLVNPGAQSGAQGTAATLALSGSDPNGDTLTYAATGLPTGLTIDPATGVISGTPTTAGNFNVTATVSDGINVATASFTWSVTSTVALSLDTVTPPGATLTNTSVAYTASATGNNVRYRWNFGDGTGDSAWSAAAAVTHTYAAPGTYSVTLSVTDDSGVVQTRSFVQVVGLPLTTRKPTASGTVLVQTPASGNPRVWVINPDSDSVSVFDAVTRAKLAEITTGRTPRSIAQAPNGLIWVATKAPAINIIDPTTFTITKSLWMQRAAMPYGIAMSPTANRAYVALETTGQVLMFDTANWNAQLAAVSVGANPRHLSVSADGASVYVSRFITPPLPGEGTAVVDTSGEVGGQVVVLNGSTLAVKNTIVLHHSEKPDFENQGRGIPNYLGAAAISPDGTQAWVPSKQDNIKRGTLRDGSALNFQSTVRAISSRIVLATGIEDLSKRIDHDNASVATAAVYDPRGVYLFVALETSREIAVIDAHAGQQLMRIDAGRAPQGLAISADGRTLYVQNFMDRTLGVYDASALIDKGQLVLPLVATLQTAATEKLAANILNGKQLFYDARDTRLARDRYMSCATCHADGGHDGRVWDLTSQGEGLRNTISLRGRPGLNGYLHWSANFDEVQDFEGQIRTLAGGTGLMTDAQFATGTRSQPLGDRKAGVSADLDALAAYVGSLGTVDVSPFHVSPTDLSAAAALGKAVFQKLNCAACHAGTTFTGSGINTPVNVGTVKTSSGQRLYGTLTGIDVPTLRDVWDTAPYLHDGSAPTLADAVRAHQGVSVTDTDMTNLVAYLREIGRDEPFAPQNPGTGTGLVGNYFNNTTMSGTPVLTRTEAIDFNWGTAAPGTGVNADQFSARWTGKIEAPATGTYYFQAVSDEGVRVKIGTTTLISAWGAHTSMAVMSTAINLVAGQKYDITVEYYDNTGAAEARLQWRAPGWSTFTAVPADRLYAQ